MSQWQLGQFVPIRFTLIESEFYREWLKRPRAIGLYIYLRRYVWRSRSGRLGGYYERGFLAVEGYMGTWADVCGVSPSTISRDMTWMEEIGAVRLLRGARNIGGKAPNIYALGQVYDVPGGTDQDAVELYYIDYLATVPAPDSLLADEEQPLLALEISAEASEMLIPRGEERPLASMQKVVAPMQKVVAPMQKVVAPMQRSNREEIEKNREEIITAPDGAGNSAETHLNRMREKFGGDPLSVAAHCQEAREEAGDLAGWTATQEALGNDGAGEQLLRAFLRMRGIAPDVLPEKKAARWSRQLARLSGDAGMTEDQAVRVIEAVLHPDHPDFGYYHGQYNDPANAKFRADFTAVALQVASGNEDVLAWKDRERDSVKRKPPHTREGEWSVAELEGARAAAIAEEPIDVAVLLGPEA